MSTFVKIKQFEEHEIGEKYGIYKDKRYKVLSEGKEQSSDDRTNRTAYIIQGSNSRIPIAVYSDEVEVIEIPMSVVINS